MMAIRKAAVVLLLFSIAATGEAATRYLKHDARFFEPTEEVVTPHVPWAKPLEGGPVRVLFLTHRKAVREAVEIAQRIDLQYELFATELQQEFNAIDPECPVIGTDRASMEARLGNKLTQDYDVIVAGNLKWDLLPGWARNAIIEKFRAGTGLVGRIWMGVDEFDADLDLTPIEVPVHKALSPFPFKGLPSFASHAADPSEFARETIEFGHCGKGRVALLKGFTPPLRQMVSPPPVRDGLKVRMINYDYYLGLTARLILWAAGREPDIAIRQPVWSRTDDACMPGENDGTVQFSVHARRPRRVKIEFVLRDRWGRVLQREERRARIAEGESSLSMSVGRIPAGNHFVDLWIRDGGKVIDFATLHLDVHATTRLVGLELVADHFRKADSIKGQATVANPTGAETLRFQVIDSFGRVTTENATPVMADGDSSMVDFELDPAGDGAVAIIQAVEAQLWRGRSLIAVERVPFSLSDLFAPQDIRYAVFETSFGPNFIEHLLARQYHLAGFDSYWTNPDEKRLAPIAARANIYRMTSDLGPSSAEAVGDPDRPVRSACLTDPATIEKIKETNGKLARRLGKFSNRDYSLASEGGLVRGHPNICFSPSCLESFREFLKADYRSIEALNAEYETSFESWDEIEPVSRDAAINRNLVPLWVDHRRHMESVWADYFRVSTDALRAATPEARVGYQATNSIGHMSSYGGVDYWKLGQAMTLDCPYTGPFHLEAARDFMPKGSLLGGAIYGGYEGGRYVQLQKWVCWRALFRGGSCMSVFRGMGHGTYRGQNTGNVMNVVAPDLSFYPFFQENIRQVRELKQGIGKLLMESDRADDGIAVLYSSSSTHASTLTPGLPELREVLRSIPNLFEEHGFQIRIVSYEQLADGALRDGGFRLLYLPYCQAMSEAEVSEVKEFVRGGGAVIADLRPAVADEHGKTRDAGGLDDVFGIRQQTGSAEPIEGMVSAVSDVGGFSGRLMMTLADASLEVTTGQALGECVMPALIRENTETSASATAIVKNRFGEGTAYLLNFSLSNYGVESGSSTRIGELLTSLLDSVSIQPEIRMESAEARRRCDVFRFRGQKAAYIGVLHHVAGHEPGHDATQAEIAATKPLPVELTLPAKTHLYDARRGIYHGERDGIRRTIDVGEAWMLSAMPYRVIDVAVEPDFAEIRQGEAAPVRIRVVADSTSLETHVVNVRFFDPEGAEALHYARNLVCEGGRGQFRFQSALNEAAGAWRIQVRDAATGMDSEVALRIIERERTP
jgi:hypothetical protein